MKKIFMKIILLSFVMTCLVFALRVDAAEKISCDYDIGSKKFKLYKNKKYEYHIVDNEVHLTAIKKVNKVVKIPSKIDGKKVVSIEDSPDNGSVFGKVNKQRYIVQEVIIPNTVKKICENAFAESEMSAENRVMIEDVVFKKGSKLKQINMDAFSGCHLLNNFEFPKSVRYIGDGAFIDTKLQGELILPPKLKVIRGAAFGRTEITKVKIPNKVTSIETCTFTKCKSLKKVVLHDNIKKIDIRAFEMCKSLNKIDIPKSVEEFGLDAFNETRIKKIVLGKKVKNFISLDYHKPKYEIVINKNNPYFKIVDGGLYNKKLTKLLTNLDMSSTGKFIISNEVKKIKERAFIGAMYSEIYIGDNVEVLPEDLFNCKNTKIYLGKNVREIGSLGLSACRNSEYVVSEENPYFKTIDGVLFNKDMTVLLAFPHTTKITSYTVPEGVKTIAGGAFSVSGKTTIEEIRLNSDLVTIEGTEPVKEGWTSSTKEMNFVIENKKGEKIHVYAGDKIENIQDVHDEYTIWHVVDKSKVMQYVRQNTIRYVII